MMLRDKLIALVDAKTDGTGCPNGDLSAYDLAITAARMALEDAALAMDEREEYWQGRSYAQSSHGNEAKCVSNMVTYSACGAIIREVGASLSATSSE